MSCRGNYVIFFTKILRAILAGICSELKTFLGAACRSNCSFGISLAMRCFGDNRLGLADDEVAVLAVVCFNFVALFGAGSILGFDNNSAARVHRGIAIDELTAHLRAAILAIGHKLVVGAKVFLVLLNGCECRVAKRADGNTLCLEVAFTDIAMRNLVVRARGITGGFHNVFFSGNYFLVSRRRDFNPLTFNLLLADGAVGILYQHIQIMLFQKLKHLLLRYLINAYVLQHK